MFEAIHGSAPRRAGQNLANPSGLLLAAVMMLVHIDQPQIATRVHNAWLHTLEEGIHTYDIFVEGVSKQKVGTKEFAQAVINRLGEKPKTLKEVAYTHSPKKALEQRAPAIRAKANKALVGVDIYLDWNQGSVEELGHTLQEVHPEGLELTLITNRGAKVWPNGIPETFTTDHWRCRYLGHGTISHDLITNLLHRIAVSGFDCIKTENLYNFDGQPGYSSVVGA
jgi:isocitrate dehydrogenase